MKQSKFVLWGLLILFTISFINCGGEKTEKEKAVDLAKLTYESMTSDDFEQIMKDAFEGKPDKYEEKMNEIAQDAGFKDMQEAEKIIDKYKNEPEIKEYENKINERMQKIMTDIMSVAEKTEKEKAVDFAKLTYEFMTSDAFMEMMKDSFAGKPDQSEEKMNEIAKQAGFKDMQEAEQIMAKYKDDPEIKEYEKKLEEHMKKIMSEMMPSNQ